MSISTEPLLKFLMRKASVWGDWLTKYFKKRASRIEGYHAQLQSALKMHCATALHVGEESKPHHE